MTADLITPGEKTVIHIDSSGDETIVEITAMTTDLSSKSGDWGLESFDELASRLEAAQQQIALAKSVANRLVWLLIRNAQQSNWG